MSSFLCYSYARPILCSRNFAHPVMCLRVCVCAFVFETERERDRGGDRERKRDRQTDIQTGRQIDNETAGTGHTINLEIYV